MERLALVREGKPTGEVRVERQGLYTCFTARAALPDKGLWCVWLAGERGQLRLGVLEPEGTQGTICRRFSGRETALCGKILRGELRRAGETPENWAAVGCGTEPFRWAWLRKEVGKLSGALVSREGKGRLLALPWDRRGPFPLVPLFCLGRLRCIGGRYYIVYALDENDRPYLPEEEKNCKN